LEALNWRDFIFRLHPYDKIPRRELMTRVQDWEQQNKGSGLGRTEQGFRTWNNKTRAQD